MPAGGIPPVLGVPSARSRGPIYRADSLLGFWPLQSLGGTDVPEATGRYRGTTSGSATPGQSGPNGLVSLGLAGGFVNTGVVEASVISFTVACLFKTTANSGNLFGGRNGTSSLSLFMGQSGGNFGGNGRLRFYFDGNSLDSGISTDAAFNDGRWHHVVGVLRGRRGIAVDPATNMDIFVDGRKVAVSAGTFSGTFITPPLLNTAVMQIGAKGDNGTTLTGNFALLGAWSRAFTADEARALCRIHTQLLR